MSVRKEYDPAKHNQKAMRNLLKSGGIYDTRFLANQDLSLMEALKAIAEIGEGRISELAKKAIALTPEEVAAWAAKRRVRFR